jgi:hypothetical protein
MVSPLGGIEYMAGGPTAHRKIERRALVGTAKSNSKNKNKRFQEEESQKQ